jgi:hypothetical protein
MIKKLLAVEKFISCAAPATLSPKSPPYWLPQQMYSIGIKLLSLIKGPAYLYGTLLLLACLKLEKCCGSPISSEMESRNLLCFCRGLDLENGIGSDFRCLCCRKFVLILRLELYNARTCVCPIPGENEFFLCELCGGVIRKPDGSAHRETIIGMHRAMYYVAKTLSEHRSD